MRKFLIFITTLLFLQGCNFKGTYSDNQIQNLVNSIKIDNYKTASFDTKANKLTINLDSEVVSKEDFDKELSTLVIGNFLGSSVDFSKEIGRDDNIVIELVSTNGNSLDFNMKDSSRDYKITATKYSSNFTKSKLAAFSNNIISFDELAGSIETDLASGRSLGSKKDDFDKVKSSLDKDIAFVKTLNTTTSELENIDNINARVENIETLINIVAQATNNAVASNNSTAIANEFLKINDLDKFARSIKNN